MTTISNSYAEIPKRKLGGWFEHVTRTCRRGVKIGFSVYKAAIVVDNGKWVKRSCHVCGGPNAFLMKVISHEGVFLVACMKCHKIHLVKKEG